VRLVRPRAVGAAAAVSQGCHRRSLEHRVEELGQIGGHGLDQSRHAGGSETLTPNPVSTATDVIDASQGTVHMILGGGGVSGTTNQAFFTDGTGKVITSVSATPGPNGKRVSTYTKEQTVWSAVRDLEHPYGFAAFTVDPGRHPGDMTAMYVTYYNVNKPSGELSVFETFTLRQRRSDG
jgi:hypothetical protein